MEKVDDDRDIFDRADMIESVLNQHTFQLDEIRSSLQCAEKRKSILLNLEEKTDDNMKRLNQMMLELKALVAIVRPQVKKTGWYGDEINTNPDFRESTKLIDLELKSTE